MPDISEKFRITPKNVNSTLQTIHERIKRGYEIQEIVDDQLPKEDIVKFNDAIIVAPDYQREYRSSVADESSLVESILLGIPIPPVFLASHKIKGVQVLNVVDGQHRLRAFFRYFENEFALKDLKILKTYNGKYFRDLDIDDINSLQSGDVATITFRDFPGKEFELEIFNRYNKGTKPLTQQEIRHAVYGSRVNDMVNAFCKGLLDQPKSKLSKAYAISKDKYQKKSTQENIFVILSVIENGIDKNLVKSPEHAESYMKLKSSLEREDDDQANKKYIETSKTFYEFNSFIESLSEITEFPFSKEIYGISKSGNKFQVSISMILAAIFRKLKAESLPIDFNDSEIVKNIASKISTLLVDSYLEDPTYNASTTNPNKIEEVVSRFSI